MLPAIQSLPQLTNLEDALRDFCERNHIIRLAAFGSMVREDYGPDSDLDILVEFAEGRVPGFGFFDLQDELSQLFGRTVDLNTWGFLSPHIRDDVAREAVNIYDEAG